VRTAKRNYMGRLLNPNLPVKNLWRNLDSIGIRDKENAFVKIDPNRLNEIFSSVNTGPTPLTRPINAGSVFDFPTFSFRFVTLKEVFDFIYHTKSDSVGLDGVPLKFVKLVIGSALPLITYISILQLRLVVFLLSGGFLKSFLLRKFRIQWNPRIIDK
jgi:hypothetical protein